MAFRFNWPEFDATFYSEAKSQLEAALNKDTKPKHIVDHISVKELDMGTKPPELEILEVGELSMDKFRGIFRLAYGGDAYVVLQTKVQVNPMHRPPTDVTMATMTRHARPTVVAADRPLVVPMLLRISDLKLRGIVVLSVSRTKGITLVFKNDPLESITIGSTFDALGGVRDFLQHEIEKQLRNLFQEDLPVMIHHLSLRRLQQQQQQQQQELDMQQRAPPTPTTATASVIPGSPSTSTSSVSLPPLSDVDEYDCDDDLSLPTPTDHTFNWYQKDGLFKDDTPMAHHELLYQRLQQQQEDALSETGSATTLVESMADFYAEDDPDAPWYVVEGMEDPASPAPAMVQTPQFTEKIELRPHENSVVARFSDLTRAHHTLAMDPFTPHNTVFRSTPATSKCTTPSIKSSYHRTAPGKLPKRRVIRLAGFTA